MEAVTDIVVVALLILILLMLLSLITEALDIFCLPLSICISSFSTLFCVPGNWPPWTISLALRLLVRFGKWEIIIWDRRVREKWAGRYIFLISSLPGHHSLGLCFHLRPQPLSGDLLHTLPVLGLVTTSSLLPPPPKGSNGSSLLLAPGCCPVPW